MPLLSIEELIERFLDFRAAFIIASRLSVTPRGLELSKDIAGAEAECRTRWGGMRLSAIPEVAAGAQLTKASASSARATGRRLSA